jgi:hypothetical protein
VLLACMGTPRRAGLSYDRLREKPARSGSVFVVVNDHYWALGMAYTVLAD